MIRLINGFSLVEVLVAVTISSVVGVAMYALIETSLNSSSQYLDRQEFDEAVRQVQFLMIRPEQCGQALGGPAGAVTGTIHPRLQVPQLSPPATSTTPSPGNFPQVTVDAIYTRSTDSSGAVRSTRLIQSNAQFGRINIGPIQLVETTPLAGRSVEIIYRDPSGQNPGNVAVPYETYLVSLVLNGSTRAGRPFESRHVPFKIYVHPVNRTVDLCIMSDVDTQTCASFGGEFNATEGVCDLPPCGPPPPPPPPGQPPPPPGPIRVECQPAVPGSQCTPEVWHWGFMSTGNRREAVCICHQTCTPPQFPPPPPPTPRY